MGDKYIPYKNPKTLIQASLGKPKSKQLKYKRRDELEAELEELKSRICENCKHLRGLVEMGNNITTAPYCGFFILRFNLGISPYITLDVGTVDYKEASCFKWEKR